MGLQRKTGGRGLRGACGRHVRRAGGLWGTTKLFSCQIAVDTRIFTQNTPSRKEYYACFCLSSF